MCVVIFVLFLFFNNVKSRSVGRFEWFWVLVFCVNVELFLFGFVFFG